MPTVTDFTKAYGVQPNTIRHWSSNFADFLSPGANPEKGQRRRFTYEDALVIGLIGEMRKDNESYESIRAALADGDRGQWSPDDHQASQDDAGEPQQGEGIPMALITQLTARASHLEGELGAIREERDHLRDQLQQWQDNVRDAEKRATIAETKLEALSSLNDAEPTAEPIVSGETERGGEAAPPPPAAPVPRVKLNRWQRIRRRIAGVGL